MIPLAQSIPIQFATPLSAASWAVLAGIPVGIVALYFLKLRRRPVQVASTLLWRRSIEDLHVNSLFQRLRRNLLLLLQLLAVLLAMFALAGPRIRGTLGVGQRYILAIDESASMSATDVAPTRLAKAKAEAKRVVSSMESGDLAMIIAFSDRARVVSTYTGNRALLAQRIDAITPTQGTTSLREALQVASGLANPARQADVPQGVIASEVNPPRLYVYTDGGFPDVDGFSLGKLVPEVVVIGPAPPPYQPSAGAPAEKKKESEPSDNVAILAMQANRNEEKPDRFQVFGRVHNFRAEATSTEARLYKIGGAGSKTPRTLLDAVALKIDAGGDQSFKFDLDDSGASVDLEVRLDVKDALPVDDVAYTVFGRPRRAQVLLVTPGNRYLADALRTPTAETLLNLATTTPEGYKTDAYSRDVAAGRYDLVIFDGVRPDASPEANALYFGALPPGKAFDAAKAVENPAILDWDIGHPLLQHVRDLRLVLVFKALVVEPPPGSTTLIDSNLGPLGLMIPRSGFTDAVVTFGFRNGSEFNTDWPKYLSFPLFLYNALRTLGNASDSTGNEVHRPGQPVVLRADAAATSIDVTDPAGSKVSPKRTAQGTFLYNGAESTGLYRTDWSKDGHSTFAVNLFDARESDLAPRGLVPAGTPKDLADSYGIKIGFTPVQGTVRTMSAIKDWWWPITAVVLGIVLFEWYVYNRRVYL